MNMGLSLTASLALQPVKSTKRAIMSEHNESLDDPLGESRPWPVRIFTLGGFKIYRVNEQLRFSRKVQRRPLSLLKALLAFGGQQVSEARLIDVLWPEAQGHAARFCLDSAVYRLRRLLGDRDVIVRQANRISLDARQVWVDAWIVERLLQRAEQYVTGESFDAIACCVTTAVALYRGPFLHEEEGAAWAQAHADRLRRRVLSQLFLVGRQLEMNEREQDAIRCYDQCLAIDPCAEEVCRQLMTLSHRVERLADALPVYRQCHDTLTRQLGVSASAQTDALLKEICGGES